MRTLMMFYPLVAVMSLVAVAAESSLKSGLQPGEEPGPFTVEKVAGAKDDNVSDGEHLCYRCMLGNKPVVMVFARHADAKLAALVKELDKKVAANSDKKLSSFLNLLGKDSATLKAEGKKFASQNKIENVAIVVPEENENGPKSYQINPDADVTVLIYRNLSVAANHSFAAGKLDKAAVDSVLADMNKILQ
jgi:hypothetical protein